MREKAFQTKVLKVLRARGGEWVRYIAGEFGTAGVADIIGCYKGAFIAIELKRPDGKGHYGVTPLQQAFINRVLSNGGFAFAASDLETIITALDSIDHPVG